MISFWHPPHPSAKRSRDLLCNGSLLSFHLQDHSPDESLLGIYLEFIPTLNECFQLSDSLSHSPTNYVHTFFLISLEAHQTYSVNLKTIEGQD